MFKEVWVCLAFRNNTLKIMLASEAEQPFAITVHVVTIEEPFASFRHYRSEPLLTVYER